MIEFSQDARPLRVALGEVPANAVLLTAVSGTEAISELFAFTLSLVTPVSDPLRFADVLGKPAAVAIDRDRTETRHIHGLIRRLRQSHRDARYAHYEAELVPPLWLFTRVSRSRIFQGKTVPEIAREVIGGLYTPTLDLRAEYHPRKTCAQYRETDFAFLSRLLEEEGIYFYFTHSADGQQLVLSDHPHGHQPTPGEPLRFQDDDHTHPNDGRLTAWGKQQELRTGGVQFTDHWFELPTNPLWAEVRASDPIPVGAEEHDPRLGGMGETTATDHPWGGAHWRDGVAPGGTDQPGDLDPLFRDDTRIARVRLEQVQTGAVRIDAAGTYARLTAGRRFTLAGHFDADGEYVAVAVRHTLTCPAATSGGASFTYTNAFECQPFALPFRPQRVTPRPAIHGTQTGVVVGSDGAEIDPDKYGRVKVWFRWDPAGRRGLDTSCWVRVAQAWAGKRWGAQFVPRVGDEVVVAFENGDPDQPLVIGSVYNADNMPVFPLPENRTQTGLRTHSSPDGTTATFNEIKFEDKKGEEVVSVHAEKDLAFTVEDNYSVSIGAAQKDPRKQGKSSSTTFGDTSYTVTKGDYRSSVAAGKGDYFVKGPVTEVYDATQSTTATSGIDIVSRSAHIHLTAPTEITLTVGGSQLTLTPDSITLKSANIHFEGGTNLTGKAPHIGLEGTTDAVVTAPAVTVHGDNTVDVNAAEVNVAGEAHAVMSGGGGGQAVKCDGGAVAVSGKAIKATADGTHEIVGSVVKIN